MHGTNDLRHMCRYRLCRGKLLRPVDNHHHAFCSRHCFNQFYSWRCRVCEKPILKAKRRKSPDTCHDHKCRKEFRTYPDAFSYPSSRECNYGSESAHFMRAFSGENGTPPAYFGTRQMRGWHWAELNGEHWLYANGRVVAILCGVDGDWQIRYPVTFPVKTAPTLDAARKLAINVTFWTWPVGGIKPKPNIGERRTDAEWRERDLADEKYIARDEQRIRSGKQLQPDGNFPIGAANEWQDWPPSDEGAP